MCHVFFLGWGEGGKCLGWRGGFSPKYRFTSHFRRKMVNPEISDDTFDTFDTLDPFICRHCGGKSIGIICWQVGMDMDLSYFGVELCFWRAFELGALATFKFRFFESFSLETISPIFRCQKSVGREGPYSCSLVRLLPCQKKTRHTSPEKILNDFAATRAKQRLQPTHQGIREVCWECLYQECGAGNHDPQTGGRDHL